MLPEGKKENTHVSATVAISPLGRVSDPSPPLRPCLNGAAPRARIHGSTETYRFGWSQSMSTGCVVSAAARSCQRAGAAVYLQLKA